MSVDAVQRLVWVIYSGTQVGFNATKGTERSLASADSVSKVAGIDTNFWQKRLSLVSCPDRRSSRD